MGSKVVGDGSLTFVVPVRDSRGVNNWTYAMELLDVTLERAIKQTGPEPLILLAMSKGDEPPMLASHRCVEVVRIDIDYQPLPTRGLIRTHAVQQDKGERASQALASILPQGHIMNLDWDDLVSPELTRVVADAPGEDGWKIEQGFIFDPTEKVYRLFSDMHQYNGSTLVIRADLAGVTPSGVLHSEDFKNRMLGGHRSALRALEASGASLIDFPGIGVGYRRESGENVSTHRAPARELVETLVPGNFEELHWPAVSQFWSDLERPVWPASTVDLLEKY